MPPGRQPTDLVPHRVHRVEWDVNDRRTVVFRTGAHQTSDTPATTLGSAARHAACGQAAGTSRSTRRLSCSGDSVLDVGCGTGHLSAYLQEMYGVDPSGVDVKTSVRPRSLSASSTARQSPFPDHAFDHVVISEVLHHSHDPMALIRECRRVARRSTIVFEDLPDGRLGKLVLSLHVEAVCAVPPLSVSAGGIGEYRKALAWLGDQRPVCRTNPAAARMAQRVPARLVCVRASRFGYALTLTENDCTKRPLTITAAGPVSATRFVMTSSAARSPERIAPSIQPHIFAEVSVPAQ